MKTNKKYILTEETKVVKGHTLHRIQAIRNFGLVKKGDKGGWVESESNLSHDGECWILDEAMVYDNSKVFHNAIISSYASIFGNARVFGNAEVLGFVKVFDNAEIYDHAKIYDHVLVYDYAQVHGKAEVFDNSQVFGDAIVFEHACIYDYVKICGRVNVGNHASIKGEITIKDKSDFFVFQNNWSNEIYFTYTKPNKKWKVGCFYGSGEELIKKEYRINKRSGQMYEKYVHFVESLEEIII